MQNIKTSSKFWLLTFDLKVSKFHSDLQGLSNTYEEFVQSGVKQFPRVQMTPTYVAYFNHLKNATFTDLKTIHYRLIKYKQALLEFEKVFPNTKRDPGRAKRGAFNFFGSILSSVFGLSTEQDMDTITQKMNELITSQNSMKNVMNHEMTIINATRMNVNQNRHVINEVIDMSALIRDHLNDIDENLTTYIENTRMFNYRQTHIQIFNHHMNLALQAYYDQFIQLKVETESLLKGKLSLTILNPNDFKRALTLIGQNLPSDLQLPYPADEVYQYYQIAKCTVVPNNKAGYYVFIKIPLTETRNDLEIYKVHSIPVYFKGSNYHTQISIDYSYIAVSTDKSIVSLLNTFNINECLYAENLVCDIHAPLITTSTAMGVCEAKMLLEFQDSIPQICKQVVKKSFLPMTAVALSQNRWIIFGNTSHLFTINCPGYSKSITTQPPAHILHLNQSCTANSIHMTLISRAFGHSEYTMVLPEIEQPQIPDLDIEIASVITTSLIEIPDKLDDIVSAEPTIKELKEKLHDHLHLIKVKKTHMIMGVTPVMFIILLALLVYCCVKRKWYATCLPISKSRARQTSESAPHSVSFSIAEQPTVTLTPFRSSQRRSFHQPKPVDRARNEEPIYAAPQPTAPTQLPAGNF